MSSAENGASAEDAFARLQADENRMETRARAGDLIDEVRPYANGIVAKYTEYLSQFNGDEKLAFAALIKFLQVGQAQGYYDERGFMALTAFLVRRSVMLAPNLARTMN